jgi:hypothetical protein
MVERLDEVARRSIGIKVPAARFMLSVKGAGELTVAAILGEVGDLSLYHRASEIIKLAAVIQAKAFIALAYRFTRLLYAPARDHRCYTEGWRASARRAMVPHRTAGLDEVLIEPMIEEKGSGSISVRQQLSCWDAPLARAKPKVRE